MTLRDLIHASRGLRRSPGFTLTAIATLGVGMGAATLMFSVVNAALLQPLPYQNPERLTLVWADMHARNVRNFMFSAPDFLALQKQAKSFSQMEAVTTVENIFSRPDGTPEQVVNAFVTPGFSRMMGAHLALGRDFTEQDNSTAAILSYEFWQHRYGGDPNIVGKTADRNIVVGVMQPGFELLFPPGTNVARHPDLWFCLRLVNDESKRNLSFLYPVGRLRPDTTLAQARREAATVTARLNETSVINRTAGFAIRLEPMREDLSAAARPAILVLMGAVSFLLLIACANVASLMLLRAGARESEWAIRLALGGSRWQTIRQLAAESLLLAASATGLGLILAKAALAKLLQLAPASLPRRESVSIDPHVLAFSILAGLAAAILLAAVPSLSTGSRIPALRGAPRTGGLNSGGRLRIAVVVTEVALSFVLLVASGLMLRTFLAMTRTDLGYEPRSLLTFEALGAPSGRGDGPKQAALKQNILRRLGALPGVTGVTASFPFPLTGNYNPIRWGLAEALTDPGKFRAADFQFVLPGYFETMRSRVLEGRVFTSADNVPKRNLVVIDNLLAAKAFPGHSAVGERILIRVRSPQPEWVEVVGVIAHQRNESPTVEGREQVYFTDAFAGNLVANRYAVRTQGDPALLVRAIRAELRQIDSSVGMFQIAPMTELVVQAGAQTRFSLLLIGVFATIAILLAGVGLYGVLATVVRARTADIGVRMAMGAAPSAIFRLVVGRGLGLIALGLTGGVAAAFGVTRGMSSMLIGVKATDPATYATMVLLYFTLAAAACWLPARRAARLQPTAALRNE